MNIFPNRFYLELQNHNIPEEKFAHKTLKKLSLELNVPMVATNDCHYCHKDDSDAHDVLFCLGTSKDRKDPDRPRYEPEQFYIKSADEMFKIFKDYPNALENTVAIAEQCDVTIPLGDYHLPDYPIDNNEKPDNYLHQLCIKGLNSRYNDVSAEIKARLEYELNVIKKMGYTGYFLITQDFVNFAKNNAIPVGPGRGSAAGSLVAYATGITDIDPIKYNLLFERFLNPERISMPDIDIDFCIDGRDRVIDYIKEKYGYKSVAQIITFGTMKAKSVIRDVGRVLSMSYGEVDTIAKMVPVEPNINLEKALKLNPELEAVKNKSDLHRELIDLSKKLEGCHRHASTHAAGVVIAPGPLTDYVPLYKNPATGDIATQADMNGLEDLGLFKFDFLGLRNLTVIDKTVALIKRRHKEIVNINNLDLNDSAVYKNIFSSSNTIGVFQFESEGMREYLNQLKPNTIADIIAMNALYRPGPMANIPEFIARKHGEKSIKYLHSSLKPILEETYGIIVYQEQVMQICSAIGGFSLAESDNIRKAMGKKKKKLLASYKIQFVDGGVKKGIEKNIVIDIFELLEKFAAYGFNKSHATAYAVIAFQTAWLKNYYPIEFMTANISSDINDTDKVVKLISDARRMGLNINHPNINTASADFTITDNKTMEYGLAAIKNVGYKVSEQISLYRKSHGQFKSIFDLCSIPELVVNKKVLESLILVGAFDKLQINRATLYNALDLILDYNAKFHKNKNLNQESLFLDSDQAIHYPELIECADWSDDKKLKFEKEYLGFYLSDSPLSKFDTLLLELSTLDSSGYSKYQNSDYIQIGGLINEVVLRYDKNGNQWAILNLDLLLGQKLQIFVFHNVYNEYSNLLIEDAPIFIKGKISNQSDDMQVTQVIANKVFEIDQNLILKTSKYINIKLDFTIHDENMLDKLEKLLSQQDGKLSVMLYLKSSLGRSEKILLNKFSLNPEPSLLAKLRTMFGKKNVWIS